MPKVTFNCRNTIFYSDLKTDIDKYFAEKKIKKTGDWRLHLKTVVLGAAAVMLYVSLLAFNWETLPGILACAEKGGPLWDWNGAGEVRDVPWVRGGYDVAGWASCVWNCCSACNCGCCCCVANGCVKEGVWGGMPRPVGNPPLADGGDANTTGPWGP